MKNKWRKKMSYTEKFKEIMITTAKGYGIGLVISILFCKVLGFTSDSIGDSLMSILVFDIIFGSLLSIWFNAKSGRCGSGMMVAIDNLWRGLAATFFAFNFDSPVFVIIAMFKLCIGVCIAIPLMIIMAVSYFGGVVYYGIRCLIEVISVRSSVS
jgi:hypothetical protein